MELINYSGLKSEDLENMVKSYMKDYENTMNNIITIDNTSLKWENLIQPLLDLDLKYLDMAKLQMKEFYPDENIRETCNDLDTELSEFSIEQEMRKDYFQKFSYYFNNNFNNDELNLEQLKYLENTNDNYKDNGMYLDEENYEKVKEIKKSLERLTNIFSLNLNKENTTFEFTLYYVCKPCQIF